MAEVVFTDAAIDDLRRLGPEVVPKVLKKVLFLLDDPEAGSQLTGFRKLAIDRWRVVCRRVEGGTVEICQIWHDGARSDAEVYAEAVSRVAEDPRPDIRRLADVVGRLAGHAVLPPERRERAGSGLARGAARPRGRCSAGEGRRAGSGTGG